MRIYIKFNFLTKFISLIYFKLLKNTNVLIETLRKLYKAFASVLYLIYKLSLPRLELIGSLRSTTRPTRRRAFKTKQFGVSTNNSIMCFIAMQSYKEFTKKFVISCKTKTVNNLWSHEHCQPRCHSQHNVKKALLRLSGNAKA